MIAADLPDAKAFPLLGAEVSAADAAEGVEATAVATNGVVRLSLTTPVAREIAWCVRCGGQ